MRGDTHVRFGGRAGETGRAKSRNRAPARPLHLRADLENVQFANDEIVERLFPLGRNVPIVLDPERSFGEPTVSSGVRTDVLAELVDAGEAPERLAEIYALPVSDIQHAVQFEHDRANESPAA